MSATEWRAPSYERSRMSAILASHPRDAYTLPRQRVLLWSWLARSREIESARNQGKVAIVAGSQGLRDHAVRIFGFNQVMASEFSQLDVLPVIEGRDADERSEHLMMRLLSNHPDIAGLYNVGAGTPGVAKALIDSGACVSASIRRRTSAAKG